MSATCIMVLGTTSGAGKSFLTTALCRWYARQGYRVAPFKAQNMSNNARVVAGLAAAAGGVADNAADMAAVGEIGSAQYFQALAAGARPDVRMNPILLKPEADTHSQFVLMGQVHPEFSAMAWHERSLKAWPFVQAALDDLRQDFDVVVIEGAGSPAEINLQHSDIVNMRVAEHAQARCLLITDIDRGGAFAHLYGTWHFLTPQQRRLISGFVLNKFRGDAGLLAPAPQMLQEATGVPTVATLPMWRHHGLPEEDGVFEYQSHSSAEVRITVAVLAYPHISNLDEFQPLNNIAGLRLVWARTPAQLQGADWLILPGSKNTQSDLQWLCQQGLDESIKAHVQQGKFLLGICGGLQMLGQSIHDPLSQEGGGSSQGLGLLALRTELAARKTLRHTRQRLHIDSGPWQACSGLEVEGYEIHFGQTTLTSIGAEADTLPIVDGDLGWRNASGHVMGIYIHGLFENPAILETLLKQGSRNFAQVCDGLADYVDEHFEAGFLAGLLV